MQIMYMGSGPYHDWCLDGDKLTIAGQTINLDKVSSESQEIVDIMVNGKFAANIILPARESVCPESEDAEPALKPLATERVKIMLWSR